MPQEYKENHFLCFIHMITRLSTAHIGFHLPNYTSRTAIKLSDALLDCPSPSSAS